MFQEMHYLIKDNFIISKRTSDLSLYDGIALHFLHGVDIMDI